MKNCNRIGTKGETRMKWRTIVWANECSFSEYDYPGCKAVYRSLYIGMMSLLGSRSSFCIIINLTVAKRTQKRSTYENEENFD